MSLADRKITGYVNNIKDLPDTIRDSAAWLKEQFDGRTDKEVPESLNGVIEDLMDPAGAGEIGALVPEGVTPAPAPQPGQPASVQGVLGGLKKYTDDKVVEIGAADMAKAVYDTHSKNTDVFDYADDAVEAASARLMDKASYAPDATAEIVDDVLEVVSNVARVGSVYPVGFVVPEGYVAGMPVEIDGAPATLYDATGETAEFEAVAGIPAQWTVQVGAEGTRAFFKTGGGVALKVIAVANAADLPATTRKDTIAIIMPYALAGWQISADDAGVQNEVGFVWLRISSIPTYPLGMKMSSKGKTILYPLFAKAYDGTDFVDVDARVYDGTAWVTVSGVIFYEGNEFTHITGGYYQYSVTNGYYTNTGTHLYLYCYGQESRVQVSHHIPLNFGDITKVKITYKASGINVSSRTYGFNIVNESGTILTGYNKTMDWGGQVISETREIDVTSIVGDAYIRPNVYGVQLEIYKIELE